MDNLKLRPKHARWVAFLTKRLDYIYAGLEAECSMSSYTGIHAFDEEDAYNQLWSRFASKFGIGVQRATEQMIDLYGVKAVYCLGIPSYWSHRLNVYAHDLTAQQLEDFTY